MKQQQINGVVVGLVLLLMTSVPVFAGNVYVDQTLSSNIVNGTYSVSKRDNSGTDGDAYRTIQAAIDAIPSTETIQAEGGHTVYMRGGSYNEHIVISSSKRGSSGAYIHLSSYPGEWAVIDGNYNVSTQMIRCSGTLSYWIFSNFEVTGGGTSNGSPGGGFFLQGSNHLIFEYLFIHENRGSGGSNNGGIQLANNVAAVQNVTIRYNYLKNNGDPSQQNCGNITLYADYVETPQGVSITNARQQNEIAYNYIVGSNKGIKNKQEQYLSLDNTASHLTYNDRGDKYHHNIVVDFRGVGIEARQDFIQVYNNIIDTGSGGADMGLSFGDVGGGLHERSPFHAVAYNNTVRNSGIKIGQYHSDGMPYAPPFVPHWHLYNNVIESFGPVTPEGKRDLTILRTYSSWNYTHIDMSKLFLKHNLFVPRTTTEDIFTLGDNAYWLSKAEWDAAQYSGPIYTRDSTAGLYARQYVLNDQYTVASGVDIATGGLGGSHPYLSNITIPSYIGATDPADITANDWVTGVQSDLTNTMYLRSASGTPSWVAGSGSTTIPGPITPTGILLEEK